MIQIKPKNLLSSQVIKGLIKKQIAAISVQQLSSSKPYISKLTNRSLLILNGPETYKLLQGLTTNDINLLSIKNIKSRVGNHEVNAGNYEAQSLLSDRLSIYTLFLSPKGKLITDAFVYKPKVFLSGKRSFRQDQLWIDVHSSQKNALFSHLKKYLWKKQVELIDVDKQNQDLKPSIYAGYNHLSTMSSYLDRGTQIQLKNQSYRDQQYSNLMMFDPRGGNYGRRIVCMQQQFGIPQKQFQVTKQNQYEDYQKALGFTPPNISANKLPFQFNYDLLNAISFKKGCYLGQQIVSRSYFTGIVRRRVFPFNVTNQDNLTTTQIKNISEGAKLLDQSGQQVGKVIYYEKGKIGLALVPYLNFFKQEYQISAENMLSIPIKVPFQGLIYCPFQNQLLEYLTQTRKKQKNLEQLDI